MLGTLSTILIDLVDLSDEKENIKQFALLLRLNELDVMERTLRLMIRILSKSKDLNDAKSYVYKLLDRIDLERDAIYEMLDGEMYE